MRVDEANWAEMLIQVNSAPPDVAGHVPLVVGVAGHPLAVGHDGRKIWHGWRAVEAERSPQGPIAGQPGGAGQRPHRRRAAVEARAADLACFEHGDVRAKLAGLESGGEAGRSPADHQQVARSAHRADPDSPPAPGLMSTG